MGAIKLISPSGSVTLEAEDTAGASTVVIPKAGVVSPDSLRTELNASGTAPIYACRAWVNFNGTGTVAIRASGNVSSITDNGVGDYTVNILTAMPDADFCWGGTSSNSATHGSSLCGDGVAPTVSSFRFLTVNQGSTSNATADALYVNAYTIA